MTTTYKYTKDSHNPNKLPMVMNMTVIMIHIKKLV